MRLVSGAGGRGEIGGRLRARAGVGGEMSGVDETKVEMEKRKKR